MDTKRPNVKTSKSPNRENSFRRLGGVWALASLLAGCAGLDKEVRTAEHVDPASAGERTQPVYDTTIAKTVPPRDSLERWVYQRRGDLRLVDRLMDERTKPPEFDRLPLPPSAPEARITDGLTVLDDQDPFPEIAPLPPKEVTIRVGIARSTYRTREPEEVLSALGPFIDLVQREVNIRGAPALYESAEEIYFGLIDGSEQMVISHVFDYLLVRSWLANLEGNATVLLAWARPAHAQTSALDRDLPGIPGTSVELIVAHDSPYRGVVDLRGARLAVTANYVLAPGTFLTDMLASLGHPSDQPFFSSVRLRRYTKDAVIDVIKGKADAACVDQGTLGALDRFYGLGHRLRTLAVSPRYNFDVLYTSLNNLAARQTEIELTQRQLTTLGKDPEGQEVLFFFDTEGWYPFRSGDLSVPRKHFAAFERFIDNTPVDLTPLLDPRAAVDRQTYDRYGDE